MSENIGFKGEVPDKFESLERETPEYLFSRFEKGEIKLAYLGEDQKETLLRKFEELLEQEQDDDEKQRIQQAIDQVRESLKNK